MIRSCQCPSCGAKVSFRASTTLYMVCEYCQSTLIRSDVDVENLGKMADLLPDSSLIKIGTQGVYLKMNFAVIGRVQYQHESGIWNEWHLLFDNGKTAWLSEASGSYVISFLNEQGAPNFELAKYQLDLSVPILKERYTVIAIENVRCIAGQGELPFKVNSGYDVTVVDLSNQRNFASLDFSETPPLLFIGSAVELANLSLSNLRDINLAELKTIAKSFNCPSCAAPVQVQVSSTQTITCPNCTAVLDVSHKQVDIVVRSQKKLAKLVSPVIALGKVGRFDGVDYTVIGYLRRLNRQFGTYDYWSEYLLHHPGYGFRWLINSNEHWTLAAPLQKSPSPAYTVGGTPRIHYEKTYKHFAKYNATVVQVLGEFYWRVKFDDKVTINDYISPPHILSKEQNDKEITWTLGEYISRSEVETAFDITLHMSPRGVAPHQISPYKQESSSWIYAALLFFVLATVMQLYFVTNSDNHVLLRESVAFQGRANNYNYPSNTEPDQTSYQSAAFKVTGHPTNVVIEQSVNLSNQWLSTDVVLIEENTGEVYHAEREAGYYYGYDSDGSWEEDDHKQKIIFSKIPSGSYYVRIETDGDWTDSSRLPIVDNITVSRDVPQISNYWILIGFILVWPLIFAYFAYRFEVKRWEESDHPMETSSD